MLTVIAMSQQRNMFAALASDDDDEPALQLTRDKAVAETTSKTEDTKESKKRRIIEASAGSGRTAKKLRKTEGSEQSVAPAASEHATDVSRPAAVAPALFSLPRVGDVLTMAGGVRAEVLNAPLEGAKLARKGDVVRFLFEGRLKGCKKGLKIDNGEIDFVVGDGKMIQGFVAGVKDMYVGEKRLLHIPSRMGYGKKGKRPKVPPNADLEFTVHLVHVGTDWGNTLEKGGLAREKKKDTGMSKKRREQMKQRAKKNPIK